MKRIITPLIALAVFLVAIALLIDFAERNRSAGTVAGSMGMTISECERSMQVFMAYYERHLARDRCSARKN